MPAIVSHGALWYIVENNYIYDDKKNKKVNKRTYLEKLGKCGKRKAKIALARAIENPIDRQEKMSFSTLYNTYKNYYKLEIDRTIKQRTYDRFLDNEKHLSFFDRYDLRLIGYNDIENFKQCLLIKGLGNRSINICLMDVGKVMKYAVKMGFLNAVPIIDKLSDTKKIQIDRLTKDEVNVAIEKVGGFGDIPSIKVKFYIQFMLFTGIRPQEMSELRWENINIDKKYIQIISDNSLKKGRSVYINKSLLSIIIDRKETINPVKSDKVSPYTSSGISKMLQKLSKFCGFKIYPYVLRKTFGSLMAESGMPITKLSESMGNSVAICQKYYISLNQHAFIEYMENHPLS